MSVKATSVCVVDDAGKVILEQKIPTEPGFATPSGMRRKRGRPMRAGF